MKIALLATLATLVTGCTLYYGGNDPKPDAPCYTAPPSNQQLRDPTTGQCETVSSGCNACEPCGTVSSTYPADWASCDTKCLGMSEATCLAAPGCQAEYLSNGSPSYSFWGCFATAPSGPIEGSCDGLDAYGCSRHDDCEAYYGPVGDGDPTGFVKCVAETPPPPPPACDTLTTEADCKLRSDCVPIYDGQDCTCDSNGCTCKTETFAKCQAR